MKKLSNFRIDPACFNKNLPVMVSACLLGIHCRYDGEHSCSVSLRDFASSAQLIPFCPEQLGGLPTPRPPADIIGGDGHDILSGSAKVINIQDEDVTKAFVRGAEESLVIAGLTGSLIAVMKNGSPSCGLKTSYCEKPSGSGTGITAALFKYHGIKMIELGRDDPFPNQAFMMLLKEIA